MKALSLTEPWATLVARGAKMIETRSWSTTYRGHLCIHVAKAYPPDCRELCDDEPFASALGDDRANVRHGRNTRGVIIAVARLVECFRICDDLGGSNVPDEPERSFGNYEAGRYGFRLADVVRVRGPVAVRGALGLWDVPAPVMAEVLARATGPIWKPDGDGGLNCQHGHAIDVHCCHCHSGVVFDGVTHESPCPLAE